MTLPVRRFILHPPRLPRRDRALTSLTVKAISD